MNSAKKQREYVNQKGTMGGGGHSFAFYILNLTDIPNNGDSHKILALDYVKYLLSRSGLTLNTVAPKVGLIWRQGGFLLRLFSTQMLL